MRPTAAQSFTSRSWVITLLIGVAFVSLEYALWAEIGGHDASDSHSWFDLALLLSSYLFMFCLKPIQKAVQRKLWQQSVRKSAH